jgi:hypothetical protein
MPREHERLSRLLEVTLESASGRRQVRISDVSLGGCFIETISQLDTGERATFEITGQDGEAISFSGTVAYAMQGVGFGMKFDELTDVQEDFLRRVVGVTDAVPVN